MGYKMKIEFWNYRDILPESLLINFSYVSYLNKIILTNYMDKSPACFSTQLIQSLKS